MRRLKTVRRPPIYPKAPGHLPCSSLTHPLPLSSRRPSVSFGGFGLRGPDDSFAVLSGTGAGHDLALFRALPDQSPGLHHIGFVVDDERDMDEAEERLKKMRIEPELRLDHDTKRSIYLRSPDGLLLEFYSTRSAPLTKLSDMEPGLALHLA